MPIFPAMQRNVCFARAPVQATRADGIAKTKTQPSGRPSGARVSCRPSVPAHGGATAYPRSGRPARWLRLRLCDPVGTSGLDGSASETDVALHGRKNRHVGISLQRIELTLGLVHRRVVDPRPVSQGPQLGPDMPLMNSAFVLL